MAFKLVVLASFVAIASAGLLPAEPYAYHAAAPLAYAAAPLPLAKAVITKELNAEHDPNPQYSYAYNVDDALTGDSKSQHETRDGDVVHGSYSLLEADGTRRIVDYTADPLNGFNAVVRKEPAAVAVKAIAQAPIAYEAHSPALVKTYTPALHSAPFAPAYY